LAVSTAQAQSLPLPTVLGGATLALTDSAGVRSNAALLYASPTQINFVVPATAASGAATVSVTAGGVTQTFPVTLKAVAPGLFSMNSQGTGVAAALAVAVQIPNPQLQSPVPVFQCANGACVSTPIDVGVDRPIYISFYGTGIRNLSSQSNVTVTIDGVPAPVQYAGPAPNFAGLDQVNVLLPLTLRGHGESNVVVTVDGVISNAVTIDVQ
jgi:uncharacterized protein (TIGR03437 family)